LDAPRRKSDPAELQVTSRRQAGDLIRVGPETLRGWVEQEERNAGAGPSPSDEASAEVRQPRKENSGSPGMNVGRDLLIRLKAHVSQGF
jgi:transposase-like protein